MEITKDDLRKRYEALGSEDLIQLYNQGDGLTETAKSVLMEIMSIRDDIDLELIKNKKQNKRNEKEAEEKSIERSINEISLDDNGIELYKNFIINPKEHTVSNVKRVEIRATQESIKNLIIATIFVIIATLVSIVVVTFILEKMAAGSIKTIFSTAVGAFIIGLWYYLISTKVKVVFSTAKKPKLDNPENAVKTFLSSTKNELYNQAYNFLTDQAQTIGRVNMTAKTNLQKQLPDINIKELSDFSNFWKSINFPWKFEEGMFEKVSQKKIDDETAIVEIELQIDKIIQSDITNQLFNVRFCTVKRDGIWFMANGFFWPIPITLKKKEDENQ